MRDMQIERILRSRSNWEGVSNEQTGFAMLDIM